MAKRNDLIPAQNSSFFQDLILRVKLIWRLMGDRRVNFFLKLLPVGALIYLISPIDLIPDLALPVIGVLDDAVVLWLGTSLFVALCPDDVVQEHMNALQKVVPASWREAEEKSGDIVKADARDVQEDDK